MFVFAEYIACGGVGVEMEIIPLDFSVTKSGFSFIQYHRGSLRVFISSKDTKTNGAHIIKGEARNQTISPVDNHRKDANRNGKLTKQRAYQKELKFDPPSWDIHRRIYQRKKSNGTVWWWKARSQVSAKAVYLKWKRGEIKSGTWGGYWVVNKQRDALLSAAEYGWAALNCVCFRRNFWNFPMRTIELCSQEYAPAWHKNSIKYKQLVKEQFFRLRENVRWLGMAIKFYAVRVILKKLSCCWETY